MRFEFSAPMTNYRTHSLLSYPMEDINKEVHGQNNQKKDFLLCVSVCRRKMSEGVKDPCIGGGTQRGQRLVFSVLSHGLQNNF